MSKRVAVIDLGTNTFHLLIAESAPDEYNEIIHEQVAVKLGEGGINQGVIQPAAFERGIKAMQDFKELISKHHVGQVKALATSALRNAANGQQFIDMVKNQTGVVVEAIDGNTEAKYIYKGIKAAGCLSKKNSLIMDIGGGSVEFIICNLNQINWKQSFEIGAARLMDIFHRRDPIAPESITALNLYLEGALKPLSVAASNYPIQNLTGSSGVFESFAGLIESDKGKTFDHKKTKNYTFDKDALLALIERLILSTHQERAGNKEILPIRVDMIVTASILTRFVIEKLGIEKVGMSTNSLKEGVLAEIMD
jgi:exopolyphosphatase/guanosine-5'-triphosphate,3'-diphosphate pyrophosphatase